MNFSYTTTPVSIQRTQCLDRRMAERSAVGHHLTGDCCCAAFEYPRNSVKSKLESPKSVRAFEVSVVWKFFGFDVDQKTLCKCCGAYVVDAGSNTSNLLRHLTRKHVLNYQD